MKRILSLVFVLSTVTGGGVLLGAGAAYADQQKSVGTECHEDATSPDDTAAVDHADPNGAWGWQNQLRGCINRAN